MPKDTNEKELIANNLKYIGLDLEKIPEFLLEYKDVDFKPSKTYEENTFKVYRHIHLNDIQILLTPKNRLNTIVEKYSEAEPLAQYLDTENEENIIKYANFLKMAEHINKEEIEKIEEQQKELNKKEPFKIKYTNNYLWQIYYSEYTGKYFMLVTIEDLDYSCFFYLLKKQIEAQKTGKDELIFVPVNGVDYTRRYLKKSEISDLEKYIWLFSKEWPQIYEVFDDDNELVMHVVGTTIVYDKIKTWFKNSLKTKEEANRFYKLVKALFILQTELPHYYKFDTQIGEDGELVFEYNSKLITYEGLSKFIKDEYKKYAKTLQEIFDKKEKNDIKLEKLRAEEKEKNLEYLFREKQVATYLECRTSVFGRIRYFFKNKNGKFVKTKSKQDKKNKQIKEEIKIEKDITNKIIEEKEYYTIEDLIKICVELDRIQIKIKNIDSDVKALEDKIKSLDNKIKNATLYIEKIEEHKKSIFEFWKFANKDEAPGLNPGTEEKEKKQEKPKLKKTFNYEEDFEDLGIEADKLQRDKLTRKECDSVYIASTEIIDDLNKIKEEKEINSEVFDKLKKEAEQEIVLFNSENFDIFGNVKEDKTKISILANKKHREVKKDKFKILDISKNMQLEEYEDKIKECYESLEKALKKIKAITDINLYMTSEEKLNTKHIAQFHINPINAIEETDKQNEKINLYKLSIKEGMNIIYNTNIMYYDNVNNTLPKGMNISDNVLIDMSMYNIKLKKQKVFRINKDINDIETKTKIVCVYEYEIQET